MVYLPTFPIINQMSVNMPYMDPMGLVILACADPVGGLLRGHCTWRYGGAGPRRVGRTSKQGNIMEYQYRIISEYT